MADLYAWLKGTGCYLILICVALLPSGCTLSALGPTLSPAPLAAPTPMASATLLSSPAPLSSPTPLASPTPVRTPTATPRFGLPSGYTAYPDVTVVVVDISSEAQQGATAQEAIIRQARMQGIDVLVLGCLTVDDAVSVCPTTPFLVRGSASVGAKRALR